MQKALKTKNKANYLFAISQLLLKIRDFAAFAKFANFSFCSPGDQQLAAESCQALLGPQAAGRINDIIKANKCQKAEEFLDTELSMGTERYI